MPVLFWLTLIRTLTGTSVHHDARRDGMGRHDRQMTPAHGSSDEQGPRCGAILVDIYRIGGTRMKEKKDPAILKAFGSLSRSSFSSTVTHAFSWPIKGKVGHPIRGIATHHINLDSNSSNPEPIRTRKHTARNRLSSWHPFAPLTRDLGAVPLSTICIPYYELFVLVT